MASYLELNELTVGTVYVCELYSGDEGVNLRYEGDGSFRNPETGAYLSVEGDVRYVRLSERDAWLAGLKVGDLVAVEITGSNERPTLVKVTDAYDTYVTIEDAKRFRRNFDRRWGVVTLGRGRLIPLTQELRDSLRRREIYSLIVSNPDAVMAVPMDRLEAVAAAMNIEV